MRKPIAVAFGIVVLTAFAGCTYTSTDTTPAAVTLSAGFDAGEFSTAVRAQDDFYDYINAKWIAANDIPADRSRYGVFNVVFDRTESQVRSLIEAAARQVEQGTAEADEARIGSAYLSFMDEARVESLGILPIADLVSRIDGINTHQQLAGLLGELQLLDISLPVVYYVDGDAADPTRSLAYFWQGGLGLPDRDYYTNDGEKFAAIRAAYLKHIQAMYEIVGWQGGKAEAVAIYALEERLAAMQWSSVQNRDRERIYTNKVKVAENNNVAFWTELLRAGGFGNPPTVVLAQDDYFERLPEFIQSRELETWKAYLKFRVLESFAGYLPDTVAEESFAFHGKALRGQEQQRPRWKRGVSAVNRLLGESVGKLYVRDHFPSGAKTKISNMVEGLRRAFATSIDELTWMTEQTKAEAQDKLAAFSKKVGYPETWKNYSRLTLRSDALVANVRKGRVFENERQLEKLSKPVDRSEWGMTPQTVNASYRPTRNEIVFPAAILQAPFFDPAVDDAFNYGAIGSVIGHEFSHGFDDQGRKFDGAGALRDWWTAADKNAYSERAAALVAQYDAFKPLDDVNINGTLTLGENIGDLAGLTMAYRAWLDAADSTWGEAGSPVIGGYTGAQRFFIGYAHAWRSKYREAALRERLLRDPHSPGKYRVIGVLRNFDAFYSAFDVKPGDAMYLPSDQRVRLW